MFETAAQTVARHKTSESTIPLQELSSTENDKQLSASYSLMECT